MGCDNIDLALYKVNMETYISIDVEADGPIPGYNSMLSFGAVAFKVKHPSKDIEVLDVFKTNLELLPNAVQDQDTMAWWASNNEAYQNTRKDCQDPKIAMEKFATWLLKFNRPTAVGYPVAYDFMFIYWYLMRFVGKSSFSHSALDIKTAAWALLKGDYRNATKRNMPKSWFGKTKHTHDALDDAVGQAELFGSICNELDKLSLNDCRFINSSDLL